LSVRSGGRRQTLPVDRSANPVIGIFHPEHDTVRQCLSSAVPEDHLRICSSEASLPELLGEVDVLLAGRTRGRPFPREEILRSGRLQWLHLASAGVEYMLPLPANGPIVTSSAGLHGPLVADYVMAVVLEWSWGLAGLRDAQRERRWAYRPSTRLEGRTIGVLGLGHVGSEVAVRARSFGMRTIGTRHSGLPVPGVDRVCSPADTDEVLVASDVVVVALPLTGRTRGLLDGAALARIKPGGYLVAVSRGGIVDEAALVAALAEGPLAGAALDVFAEEPPSPDSPLWTAPNLTITPHISGALKDSAAAVVRLFLENLSRWTRGQPLHNLVDPEAGY
jgi:phosphoglycerate dehydrogenase-like enzyme